MQGEVPATWQTLFWPPGETNDFRASYLPLNLQLVFFNPATGSQRLHRALWVQAGNGLMRFHLSLGGQRCSTPPLPEYVIVPIEKA